MSKSKIVSTGDMNLKRGVYDLNRRWTAPRLESSVKNFGNKNIKKSKGDKK